MDPLSAAISDLLVDAENHDDVRVYRGTAQDVKPEVLVTQLPGGGYTLQAQEVMRCLRAGELESPLVPWESTAQVARTLEKWAGTVA